jgi:cardiolipin synthase
VVFIAAGITDAVDGVIARITHRRTRLGTYLDPIADKLLLTCAFVALAILKAIPGWLAIVVVSRDVIISLGFVIILLLIERRPDVKPTVFSKVNTVTQVVMVSVVLFSKVSGTFSRFIPAMVWITAITTILTGLQYVYMGARMVEGSGRSTGR